MGETTIVISRSGTESAKRRKFEGEVLKHLNALGAARVLVVESIYWLKTPTPALETLERAKGGLVVATWLYPRAAYWVLRFQGIEGAITTQPIDASVVTNKTGRKIRCINLADYRSALTCAKALLTASGAGKAAKGSEKRIEGKVPARWYPVIDDSACLNCKQCMDFCLFGVYELDKGKRVRVTNPDNCKTGCPACARVCPAGAILFPEYEAEPDIAGAAKAKKAKVAAKAKKATPGDKLDKLIDELDELDE